MSKPLSNAIARKYFLHDHDSYSDRNGNELPCCFFSQDLDEEGWGFWVRPDGTVDVDDVSSNGETPSGTIVDACVRAAVKYLRD